MSRNGRQRKLWLILRAAATVGICAWLVVNAPWHDIARAAYGLAWLPLCGALAVSLSVMFLRAARWRLLLQRPGKRGRFLPILRVTWLGDFYGSFLPSTVGGDAYRLLATRGHAGLPVSAASIMAERLMGFLFFVLGFLLGFVVSNTYQGKVGVGIVAQLAVGAIVVLALLLFISPWPARAMESLARRASSKRWHRAFVALGEAGSAIAEYRRDPATASWVIATSTLIAFCLLVSNWLILRALGATVSVGDLMVPVFGARLVAALPIFVGGLGGREATLVGLLAVAGVPVETGGAAAIVGLGLLKLKIVVGGSAWLIADACRSGLSKDPMRREGLDGTHSR